VSILARLSEEALDFFTVPTLSFRILFVFVVLAHDRRPVLHFNVTAHPTAPWNQQQLVEAFHWDSALRYLLRDRDSVYGGAFTDQAEAMDIDEVVTAPRSPWQNPFVERWIGSARRECLNHVIILDERSLRRILKSYVRYYEHSRTHLALDKDAPYARPVQPPDTGPVIAKPEVGGLHHRYERRAACPDRRLATAGICSLEVRDDSANDLRLGARSRDR
jgi:putative transposase